MPLSCAMLPSGLRPSGNINVNTFKIRLKTFLFDSTVARASVLWHDIK